MTLRTTSFYDFLQELQGYVGLVGLLLLVTVGFPWVTEYLGQDLTDVPGLTRLAALGRYGVVLLPLLLVAGVSWRAASYYQRQIEQNRRMAEEGVTYLLLPRRDGTLVRADRVRLWRRVAEILPHHEHVAFEVGGGKEGLTFSLRAPTETLAREVAGKVMAEWPEVQVQRVSAPEAPLDLMGQVVAWVEVTPENREQPIEMATPDPMRAMLTELALLPTGIQAGVQVLVREDPHSALRLSRKAARLTSHKPASGPYALRPSAEDGRRVQELDRRSQEVFLEVRLLVWAAAADEVEARCRADEIALALTGQYEQGTLLAGNRLQLGARGSGSLQACAFPLLAGMPWTTTELGGIAYLPGREGYDAAPQLRFAPARPMPASPRLTARARDMDPLHQANLRGLIDWCAEEP